MHVKGWEAWTLASTWLIIVCVHICKKSHGYNISSKPVYVDPLKKQRTWKDCSRKCKSIKSFSYTEVEELGHQEWTYDRAFEQLFGSEMGGIWTLIDGGCWDFRSFSFCTEKLLSSVVHCSFQFFHFLASGFLFFWQKKAVFQILVTDVVFVFSKLEEVKDRLARAPKLIFVVVSHYQLPSSYIFALTSMSFRNLPLL